MHKYLLILFIALLSSFRLLPDNETDKLVMKAAEGQLPVFLAKLNPDNADSLGFSEDDDLDFCTVGKPYRILVFSNDLYDNPIDEDKDYIMIRNEWKVPVVINNQNRAMLTVGGTSGNYVVSNMSGKQLAKELQQKSKGVSGDDTYYLLRIPLLSAEFFVHEANNSFTEAEFIPLSTAIATIPALNNAKKSVYTLKEVEQMVKQALTKEPTPVAPKKAAPAPKKKK